MEVRRNVGTFQLRAVRLIQRPAFLALAAIGLLRPREVLALAHVEAGEMAARSERRPYDAVAVDIDTTRIKAWLGHFEDLRFAAVRRIIATLQPDENARICFADSPHRI